MTPEHVSRCRTLGYKALLHSFTSHPFAFCLCWDRFEGVQHEGKRQQPVHCTLPCSRAWSLYRDLGRVDNGAAPAPESRDWAALVAHKVQVGPFLPSRQYWVLAIRMHGAKSLSDTPVTPALLRILAPGPLCWKDTELSVAPIARMSRARTESSRSCAWLIAHWHTHAI